MQEQKLYYKMAAAFANRPMIAQGVVDCVISSMRMPACFMLNHDSLLRRQQNFCFMFMF